MLNYQRVVDQLTTFFWGGWIGDAITRPTG